MYLLDTNTLSDANRPEFAPNVVAWVSSRSASTMFVSSMSFGEIARGIERLTEGRRRSQLERWLSELLLEFAGRTIDVTSAIAMRWGALRVQFERSGEPPPLVDLLIAATAFERGLAVVTRNTRLFEAFGVPVINPWDDENRA